MTQQDFFIVSLNMSQSRLFGARASASFVTLCVESVDIPTTSDSAINPSLVDALWIRQ